MTNKDVADLLRSVSAAFGLKGYNRFQIIAYDNAAEGIDHATSDAMDVWKQGGIEALQQIPGIGPNISQHLDELFKTGRVKHFDEILKDYPEEMFELLKIPGVGPKTALKLSELGVGGIKDLRYKLDEKKLDKEISEKQIEKLEEGIKEFYKRSDRFLLPFANEVADQVVSYLSKSTFVSKADPLGSLRRRVSTVGDIDIALASDDIKKVVEHIEKMPFLRKITEQGDNSLTLILKNGVRVDVMVQPLSCYGALLQHFTGSKHHNIKLRSLAKDKGYSLSEYGVKKISSGKIIEIKDEDQLYKTLGMQTPPPEVREDIGEIEAAIKHEIPDLIETDDLQGDLHTHTLWSDGHDTVSEMANAGRERGYKYMAITDHSYPSMDYKKRSKQIEQYNDSVRGYRVINGLEVNIAADSSLQISDKELEQHEFILASIHTSFRQDRDTITKRLVEALQHPCVNGIAHPTGRLLLTRSGYEADWEKVFEACLKYDKFLEINSSPERLDLPDSLARQAGQSGVKLVISTDAHDKDNLGLIRYGVSVARRAWLTKANILNTLSYNDFIKKANVRIK